MPSFSAFSQRNLATAELNLQRLFREVIRHFDCRVLEGFRDEERQELMYRTGRSQLRFPNSKHNSYPSEAVDVVPYPVDWDDTERFYMFGGLVLGVASQMGIGIRWGGDWDGDTFVDDQKFRDLPHFELRLR